MCHGVFESTSVHDRRKASFLYMKGGIVSF